MIAILIDRNKAGVIFLAYFMRSPLFNCGCNAMLALAISGYNIALLSATNIPLLNVEPWPVEKWLK